MFNTHQSLVKAAVWIASTILLPSCVGTELVAHSDHPGNPSARTGKLPVTVGLLSDFDAESAQSAAPHGAHDHTTASHETGDASAGPADTKGDSAVRYTCPMHPEVVRGEPGSCPKCGMKLVPKAKDPK